MAIIILGLNIPKVVGKITPACKKLLTSQGNLKLPAIGSRRSICGKTLRDPDVKRPPPFPYKEKRYTMLRSWFDRTTHRFDENSKIIVVDGAVASGKSAVAKQLAEELDMLYMPEANMDMIYINPYGYNMRQLDPQLPESCQSFDTRDFCLNPNHLNAAGLQLMLYRLKFAQYIDALAHVMNTGQGVVLDKSCYSDFAYIEAMAKEGFISKAARSVYYDVKRHTIDELMRPHLAIYLDVPVDKVQEKIKKRGRPHEQNSKALSASFLTTLEEAYKRQYLKEVSAHSELLIYDWSDGGDVEVVVEDIERIDFDKYTVYDQKLKDWRLHKEQAWSDKRMIYTDQKQWLMNFFNVPRLDCPELLIDGNDMMKFTEVWYKAPGMRYEKGYNESMGDTGILMRIFPPKKTDYL
ncbi:NADH dehydrogenase [ubiquinone] 1 alpha subcomplex subunit 10, mitochondrial [Homalodisca vitripennis]|uniref:NADH dehydrogenase [ubiquinone] 1 alpha subcomplex subunit 10, mitochondrial n=1 Tax=Homalodisca vitripennis TaxID=197043 RepID=UPI001EEC62AB|nr:NADH dehydrogenase [ubiquinone] 1 alpha subcomplex subunit 10, mitochondrial [Homalodisca vitripennis]KAG8288128.1 mitochondrial electron transport, NADH to ubiquinone [Homalodisca vitripennis]KAG8299455.1 mitochondrial electron transport, NADH to ubiquinone [Homalodisca vitripennis]